MLNHASRPYSFLLCLLAGFLAGPLAAQVPSPEPAAAIRGRVVDAESRDPVYPAELWLVGASRHTMTDRDGRFAFTGLAPGTYTLRATRLGYEVLTREDVRVESGVELDVELPMTRRDLRLKTITVTPGAYSFIKTNTSAHQTMSREDIESVPQLGEDVFRAVNRLPGLSSGDYAAHFSIRGGRHDETLILLDGLELYEPYHLKDFNEGAISIVDVETIDGVQLMTGGFPAQYGNKRSGVFDITSRTPESDHARYSVGLSFMNARAMARGPLWAGRGSWLVSARSGYMDLVFDLINQNTLPSPRYHDVFAKLEVRLNPSHRLTFDALYARDKYKFDAPSTTGFLDSLETRENARNRYGNSYVWTTLQSALGARTAVRSMIAAGLVTRFRDGAEKYVFSTDPIYTLTNERDFSIFNFKQDWTCGLSDAYVLGFGVDVRRLRNRDRFTSIVGADPNDPTADPTGIYPVTTQSSTGKIGARLGLYLSNRVRVADPLILEVGGRYDHASYTGDDDFSPRTSAALSLGGGRTLRLGWGHYRQMQGIDDVAALNSDSRYFSSELSQQWTAGLEQLLAEGSLLRVEAYYKEGSDLRPVYRNWKGGIDTFPETNEDRILVFPRKTTAKGLELFYDRKLGERFSTRASYSYSIADEEVDRVVSVNTAWDIAFDREHPIPQDQRHAANVDFTYKLRRTWSINGSLAFHTGWPATLEALVPVVDEDGEPDVGIRPTKLYGTRLPSYYRFDVRATRRWTTSHGDFRFFGELVNVTNHGNVFGYDYFRTPNGSGGIVLSREEETWFSILPSIGVSWSGSF
jgi:hypothetical protein